MSERFGRVAPLVVGGLVILESGLVLLIACLTLIIGGLAGLLAFAAGAGGATNAQVVKGSLMIALTLASPFVVAGVLATCGLLLLVRRGKLWIIATATFALLAHLGAHLLLKEGFHAWEVAPFALNASAVAAAFVVTASPKAYSRTPAGPISARS